MGIISFESFALVCIFVALGAYLVWQQVKEAGRNIEATLDRKPEDAVSDQAQEDEAQRRRMVHEADSYNQAASMEPFCDDEKPLSEREKREELVRLNLLGIANTPEHLRSDPLTNRHGDFSWIWEQP